VCPRAPGPRQTLDFLIQDRSQLTQAGAEDRIDVHGVALRCDLPADEGLFAHLTPDTLALQVCRQAARDAMEPAAHRSAFAYRAGFAGQHQKGGLKDIVWIRAGTEDPAADAVDQRSVAAHQHLKGPGIACLGQALQELAVAELPGRPAGGEHLQALYDRAQTNGTHGTVLPRQLLSG
jgi:hypothetical protein